MPSAGLKSVVATSGVAAVILGLAGQNLLGGIIAGISLQINRPYKVTDWLKVGDTYGEVMEITGVSTRFAHERRHLSRHSEQRNRQEHNR